MGRRALNPNATGADGSTLAKDKIIERIAYEMSEGKWVPYKSVRNLALQLGISLNSAQTYAAEATRLLRLSWGQDEAKLAVIERISFIGRDALERTEDAGIFNAETKTIEVVTLRKPDHRTALTAAKHLADILGLSGANSEVVVRYQQMSDSDLWREAQRFAAQLPGAISNNGIETTGEEIPESASECDPSGQATLDKLKHAHTDSRGRK